LHAVAEVAAKLLAEDISIQEAEVRLLEIETMRRSSIWKLVDTFIAYIAFACTASVIFFGGNWESFLLTIPSAGIIAMFGHSPIFVPMLSRDFVNLAPLVSGFVAAFCARIFKYHLFPEQCYATLVLAPIARILSGTDFIFSFVEIATGDAVTGTSRLVSGAINTLLVTFGITFGSSAAF
jgi:uncharacterized membrane protein YjjP (DUF1212 family)